MAAVDAGTRCTPEEAGAASVVAEGASGAEAAAALAVVAALVQAVAVLQLLATARERRKKLLRTRFGLSSCWVTATCVKATSGWATS